MATSWTKCARSFKSSWPVVAAFLLRSRETKAAKCRQQKQEIDELRRQLQKAQKQLDRRQEEVEQLKHQVSQLELQNTRLEQPPPALPADPKLKGHRYGPRMMSLAVNLARKIGLRGSETAMDIFFTWLGVDEQVPHYTSIRNWMQRAGLAAMQEPIEPADDWIWLADHSNQIGPEKALAVVAIRASQMPEPGQAIRHGDLRLLTIEPAVHWKREDMADAYTRLAERFGTPRAVLVDGAIELREGALCLKQRREDTIVLRDFKHFAANEFKNLMSKNERFAEFYTRMGRARSAIQQTELAHLTPPTPKTKARFMNLQATLDWAAMVLWVLEEPDAKPRQGISDERLEEKLGWLRSFTDDLQQWRACQNVISQGVTFVNEQGLFRGSARQLSKQLNVDRSHATGRLLAARLLCFLRQGESLLKENERLPISTEILESCFSSYKQLERQHSKGGFTSLLASFGALLKPATPETISRAFSRVSMKDVKAWVSDQLGATLTARRQAAYREFATTQRATNFAADT